MNAEGYATLLENALLPFLQLKFADKEHRFMQDNDSKHVSRQAQAFFEEHHINWWRTPPESPDLNPIENLWHELKEHIRARVKPRHLDELLNGIKEFGPQSTKKSVANTSVTLERWFQGLLSWKGMLQATDLYAMYT